MTNSDWRPPGADDSSVPPLPPPLLPPPPAPPPPPGPPWLTAPIPPGPPGRTRRPLLLALGALAVVTIIAVAVVMALGSGDDDGDGGPLVFGEAQEPSGDADAFVDEEGGYELKLPEGWIFTPVHGDTSDLGEELFPDDSEKAAVAQQAVATMPRLVVGWGLEADAFDGRHFAPNVTVISAPVPDEDVPSYDEFVALVSAGVERNGGDVRDDQRVTLLSGDAVRIEADYRNFDAAAYLYAFVVDGELWQLTISASDLAEWEEEFDAIADSFRVT